MGDARNGLRPWQHAKQSLTDESGKMGDCAAKNSDGGLAVSIG
jgi:hypothetical protein